jgi:hypothetical protein
MVEVSVVVDIRGFVRAASAQVVHGYDVIAGVGENRDHLAIEVGPAWLSMQKEYYVTALGAGLNVSLPQTIDINVFGLVGKIG